MSIILEIIAEPDKYFWYLIALGSLGMLLKMINMHMTKIDNILEALQKSVSALHVWQAKVDQEIKQHTEDIEELKNDKGGG